MQHNKTIITFLLLGVISFVIAQVDTAWVRRYNGPGSGTDEAHAITVDGAGNVYVTGYSTGSGTYPNDYATIKYNSGGETLWVRRYDGPGARNDEACAIAVDGAGNVFVTGYSYGANNDYATIKYNSVGVQQWVKRYNGPGNSSDYAKAMALDGAGNVYVTGQSSGSGTGQDYATIKYNSAGDTLWVRRYDRSGGTEDARAIAVDNSGNVYVTGASYGTNRDYTTIKYDSAGVQQWVSIYNGTGDGDDYPEAIAVDGSGNVYVTGHSVDASRDYTTIKYNPAGETLWARSYDGPGNSSDYAYAMVGDTSGNIYVTGRSTGSGTSYDYATIKYNSTGDTLWVRRYDAAGTGDDAYAIAVDGMGNVYVTGKIRGGTARDYATIKYDSAGVQQWVATYNGLGSSADEAYAIAVDGASNVYVTGTSVGSGTDFDYATIKYVESGLFFDVGCTKIEAPTGIIDSGTVITPACSVYNYGNQTASYTVRMKIGTFYDNIASVTSHAPSTYQYIEFLNWNVTELGTHMVSCSTELVSDVNNNNDSQTDSVTVLWFVPWWEVMADVPTAPSGKNPKSGSCMAGLEATGLIYFLKASNRSDFYSYDPTANIWNALETIPKGEKGTDYSDGKYPKRGAAMAAYEPDKCVFVVRGNNRLGFWKYQCDTLEDTILPGWKKMATIPLGAKRCKYGTGLTLVEKGGNDYLFLMKGAKTSEFYLYDIEEDSWTQTSSPPVGASGKIGYKKGSIMAYDGSENVYVLQGYYGSFFKYKVEKDSWTELRQYNYREMRNREGRKKKFKDGAAMVYYNDVCYCLKGGNTVEIWEYSVASDSWVQMPENWDIPLGLTGRKKVKDGGSMIMFEDFFWASKGKNTPEFYRHSLPTDALAMVSYQPTNDDLMGKNVGANIFNLTIVPNPANKVTAVRYNLPKAGKVSFKLYNVTGALVKSYNNPKPTRNGNVLIDARTLPSGVYILCFTSDNVRITRKLVLEK
jgi:uncharacterized delta-60 repeat protein